MSLGCCNSFKKCSDAGRCIHETDTRLHGLLNYKECLYKENLDKGLNFYTEYNENNRLRAEEYRAKIEAVKKGNEKIDKEHDSNSTKSKGSNRAYIEIPNRLFYIGKRDNYKGYTYSLNQTDQEELASKIGKYGVHLTNIEDPEKFIDETIGNNERCNCKVTVAFENEKYNILNYDHKGLKKETAVKIASYLINKGINAEIEEILNFTGSKILKNLKVKENDIESDTTKEKMKTQKDTTDSKGLIGQMSFFDIEKDFKAINNTLGFRKSKYVSSYELVNGTKIDRTCSGCGSIIKAGSTRYYTRVCNIEIAPYIENLCENCVEPRDIKKIS